MHASVGLRTPVTIGVDIGTTGTKVVVFDPRTGVIAQGSRSVTLHATEPGMSEADPGEWWANVAALVPMVLHQAGVSPESVAAIATSGMVPAVLLLDGEGVPLRNAVLQNDVRASVQVAEARVALGEDRALRRTGAAITQQSVGPKLSYLRQREPEVWARTRAVLGSYDWMLVALGAAQHVEENWALESGLFELDGGPFRPAVAQSGAGDILPARRSPGDIVGELDVRAAAALGLRPGVPLVVGGADHVLSAYGAGLRRPGDWLVKLGGAGDIMAVADHALVDERLYLDRHPDPGLWLPNGCMATSGSLIRWFQRLTGRQDLAELDDEAAARAPATVLTLPYFLGEKSPYHDPDLRGVIAGLRLDHDAVDIYRSVLEAIAFGFLDHVRILEELGVELGEPYITNGGSKSVFWRQIHADVLGYPMKSLTAHPGASLAAAYIASRAVMPEHTRSDIASYVESSSTIHPDPARHELYQEAYGMWRELNAKTTPTMHMFARAR
jgi:xylulokinase